MSHILTIAAREFKFYLATPMAYVVAGLFLVFGGAFFTLLTPFSYATFTQTSVSSFLQPAAITLLLLGPLLGMRLLAEEKKLGTAELLLTAPVRDSEVVLGKFFGAVGVLLGMLALSLYFPILLFVFGEPDPGPVITGYLGLFLIGCVGLAVGVFTSSLTSNQMVAAVLGVAVLVALWLVGLAAGFLPDGLASLASHISLSHHFGDFVSGIIDTRGVVYYLSLAALFLFLAIRSLENSRWD